MPENNSEFSRRSFLTSAALGSSAQAAQTGSAPAARTSSSRPNIVFVISDDLRFDGLACTGHPFARTPHLDRIEREGVTFDNFFCVTPLCSPSRASFLTGLYAHAHRIINNDKEGLSEISHTLPTYPSILYESGYETAFVGKWHMGGDDTRRPGFDHWVSFHAQGQYVNPVVNVEGERRQLRGYMTDFLNEQAVRFIEKPHRQPFSLYVGHKAVHYPYLPAARHDKLYSDARYNPPPVAPGDLEGKPVFRYKPPEFDVLRVEGVTPLPQESRRARPGKPEEVVRDMARCVASMDEGMGMIFDALERTKQLDNTLIVFTSDNGYLMGEHGEFDQKRWAYEPSIRLPLLMRYPKLIPAGSHRTQMTLNLDIAPTMLDLAGARSFGALHGKSLIPVLRDAQAPLRNSFLGEYFVEKCVPKVPEWQCVRTERWKYIHFTELANMDELYDLKMDPREEKNVMGDPSQQEVVGQMKAELARLLRQSSVRMDF